MTDIDSIVIDMTATGSRVICNPPPTDTDEDWIVLASGDAMDILTFMTLKGYTKDGGESYNSAKELNEGGFVSFRKGIINYIIVTSTATYTQHVLALRLATLMNLTKKEDRIKMFGWFRDSIEV